MRSTLRKESGAGALLERRADKYRRSIVLVEPFEPRREIDGGAERGIVHAVFRADIADHGSSGMEADPCSVDRPSFPLELGVQAVVGALKGERRGAGVGGVIGIVGRRVPDRHDRVADEFIDGAGMAHDLLRHRGEVAGSVLHDPRRIGFLRDLREAHDVGKQQRDLPPRASELKRRSFSINFSTSRRGTKRENASVIVRIVETERPSSSISRIIECTGGAVERSNF